ncbi:MAG: radical SAM protein [Verrucomicrobiae bacterium]|nr:radical SAM protein [Verrucomicrobiae bacterium]
MKEGKVFKRRETNFEGIGFEAQPITRGGELRQEIFGNKIFVRGVIEVSNFCRQNCCYCGMRRENRDLNRYRLSLDQLRKIIFEQLPTSVTDINLQAGEDPVAVREIVLPLIREIKRETSLGVSVCLGTLDTSLYAELKEAGASYYILKLETGNASHYQQVQAPGNFERRLKTIRFLAETGWFVSSGFILGLPHQTQAYIEETLRLLSSLPLAGGSVSPFIPGDQTPYREEPVANLETVLQCLAWMRLKNPHWIIPAVSAMNLVGTQGYTKALKAGANLVTINLTPETQRNDYLLYKRNRFIMNEARVLKAIEQAHCEPSGESLTRFLKAKSNFSEVVAA